MGPGIDHRPAELGSRSGNPLRGLRWGLLLAVVAALVLFAGVLVFEDGRSGGSGTPAAAPGTTAPTTAAPSPASSEPASSEPASSDPAASATPPAGPPAAPGAIVSGGTLADGWETRGWSWDSTVRTGARGPGGVPAVAVTYQAAWAGFALRQGGSSRPARTAQLRVRVYLPGPAARLGLQVQSTDTGGTGAVVQREVPSGRWVTLTATVSELVPPAGVRRVSVIAQNVTPGTALWVSDVTLR
jgi:hypothetical protein